MTMGFGLQGSTYNPLNLAYERPEDDAALSYGGFRTQVGELPRETQLHLAASQAIGSGYRDRPGASRYVQRAADPLYGKYLASQIGDPLFEQGDPSSFAQWLGGAGRFADQGIQFGTLGGYGRQPSGVPQDWSNLLTAARGLSSEYDIGSELGPEYDAYVAALQDEGGKAAQALASYATYNPQAGSILGRIRQRALGRKQDRFFTDRPGTGSIDWLAYLTDPASGLGGFINPDLSADPELMAADAARRKQDWEIQNLAARSETAMPGAAGSAGPNQIDYEQGAYPLNQSGKSLFSGLTPEAQGALSGVMDFDAEPVGWDSLIADEDRIESVVTAAGVDPNMDSQDFPDTYKGMEGTRNMLFVPGRDDATFENLPYIPGESDEAQFEQLGAGVQTALNKQDAGAGLNSNDAAALKAGGYHQATDGSWRKPGETFIHAVTGEPSVIPTSGTTTLGGSDLGAQYTGPNLTPESAWNAASVDFSREGTGARQEAQYWNLRGPGMNVTDLEAKQAMGTLNKLELERYAEARRNGISHANAMNFSRSMGGSVWSGAQ